jgi:STE24 endopeptidase
MQEAMRGPDLMELYLIIILAAYLFVVIFDYWLDYLNLSHLKKYGAVIPPEFEGHIDQGLLTRTRDYYIDHARFDFIHSIFNNGVLLIFIFVLLDIYNSLIVSLNYSFVLSGIIFLMTLLYAETVLSIPFRL